MSSSRTPPLCKLYWGPAQIIVSLSTNMVKSEKMPRIARIQSIWTNGINSAATATLTDFANVKERLISATVLRDTVASAGKRAERLYLTQIAFCGYVLLTVAGIRDVDFFQSAEANLPLINLRLRLELFLVAAPIIALSIFGYFQMNLGLLHKMMLADEEAMQAARSSAWLALFWFGDGRSRPISRRIRLVRLITSIPAWGLAPLTIFLCWARLAPFQWEKPKGFIPGAQLPSLPSEIFMIILSIICLIGIALSFFYRRFEHLVITGLIDSSVCRQLLVRVAVVCIAVIGVHVAFDRWSTRLFPLQLAEAKLDNFILTGAEFRNANLYNASLQSATLAGANLQGARLDEANLTSADLTEAHLEGAVLVSTNLSNSILVGAHMEGAYMRYANLRGASLVNANVEGADLTDAHLDGASLINTQLQGADLSGAFLIGADLTRSNPESYYCQQRPEYGCQKSAANGAHLQGAILYKAHLEGSILNSTRLDGADLTEAHFDAALLSFASLAGAKLDKATFNGATIAYAPSISPKTESLDVWIADNAKRFSAIPRLNDENLLDLIQSRVVTRQDKSHPTFDMIETLKERGACAHEPGELIGIETCAGIRRERLKQLVRRENASSDLQVAAVKDAWCVETVRLYWRNWHGITDSELELVECRGLSESLLGAY